MSMSPLVTKLKAALASVGVATSNTQDAVLMAATTYIAAISKPEKGDWIAPPQMVSEADAPALFSGDTPEGLYVTAQFDEPEMPVDSYSSGAQFDVPAKPKAKKKAATRVGR